MSTRASKTVNALIITGFGLNCEVETACAFERAGATAVRVHLNDIIHGRQSLDRFHILALIGGFSFGDHIGAGAVFANRLRCKLQEQIETFVQDGRLVIGICNGFQTMIRLGLAPALDGQLFAQQAAIAANSKGVFRDDWVMLRTNPDSPCVFTKGLDMIPLPIRHGEGRFVAANSAILDKLQQQNLVTFQYADPETGTPTMEFPHNPNGSTAAIAGICNPTGRVFGMMPHPEAYLSPYNHPHWTRQKLNGVMPERGLGQIVFDNAVRFAQTDVV